MTELKIVVEEKPQPELREVINGLLQDFNWTRVDKPVIEPLTITLRHSSTSEVIGGLCGASFGGWLFIETVFVPDALRKSGTGTLLVTRAEEVAKERGCVGVWLDTLSWQAPAFYEKLGYQIMGKHADFPRGHNRFYYFKRIDT